MKIDIITLFPKMFDGPLNESIMWRAQDKKFIELNIVDLRQFGIDERRTVDDKPYGGGAGMILRVDVIDNALKFLKVKPKSKNTKIVVLDAGGEKFTQKKAYAYSELKRLVLICGRYEGIDHRVHENFVDDIISIKQEILRVSGRFDNMQQVVIGRVDEYSKSVGDVTSEIKALEKVFQNIVNPLTSNIKELASLTKELKQKS